MAHYVFFKFAKFQPNRSKIVDVVKQNVKGLCQYSIKWRVHSNFTKKIRKKSDKIVKFLNKLSMKAYYVLFKLTKFQSKRSKTVYVVN